MNYTIQKSEDGITKIIFKEGYSAVIIPSKENKFAVCVSCQIGCPVGCAFCKSGKIKFKRNLTEEEIFNQTKVAIGYNSKKFFTGAEISLSQASHNQNKSSVQTNATRAYFQIFLGYRFNAPSFIKSKTDLVKNNSFGIIKE